MERSGFDGKWTTDSKTFDNSYFVALLNPSEELLRMPTDEALLKDEKLKDQVRKFADD